MLEMRSHITLSELTGMLDDLISEVFQHQTFWIIAETADVKNYPDRNYCFVTLIEKEGRDTRAKMDAVIWSRYYSIIAYFETAAQVSFDKNIKVLLKVSVDFSATYGLKLQIVDIDPSYTTGELEREKKATLDQLVKQNPGIIQYVDGNLVTYNKQLDRSLVFQRIALITAPDSDGRRDFLHELQTNPYHYTFNCDEFLCKIQGDGAENMIIAQLQQIQKAKTTYDAVIITRGGGSQLDFGPFDTYDLGLMIASYDIPVITGIGHERNVSIADLLSHLMVKTPTKAASFLVEHNKGFEQEVTSICEDIINIALASIDNAKNSLDRISDRLSSAYKMYFNQKQNELDKIEIALKHLDPENVLARGYAMIFKDNEIIVNPENIKVGDAVEVKLKNQLLRSLVQQKSKLK